MKKILLVLVILALSVGTSFALSVVGSKHDLRAVGGGTPVNTMTEVCVACHTPHQAAGANSQDPLWNHTGTATAAFGVYSSATLNAVPTELAAGAMGTFSVSMLCMSCHDGTVSVNSMFNPPNSGAGDSGLPLAGRVNASGFIISNANMGTTLTDDHPVNFSYDNALFLADGGLVDPTNVAVAALLIGGTVQCSSCHDVHDNANVPFLRMSNVASALCTTCHVK